MEENRKEKQFDYINEYQKKNYDRITILRKKGEKQKITELARSKGYSSLSEFINTCIDEKIKRMKVNL